LIGDGKVETWGSTKVARLGEHVDSPGIVSIIASPREARPKNSTLGGFHTRLEPGYKEYQLWRVLLA